ncbi:lysozyme [Devosia sp. 1635]|uniref:lysozyme n=1 Tax=Devosia sp. 1635 TaxID=2726066 RepID=UPI0015658B88|nr:lysozyme [Devosia sp. 1635]
MTRKVNAATLAHIKASEGLRLNAYPDPGSRNGDPWTIGYGSTAGVRKGDTITEAESERRLVIDLTHAENAVARLVKVPLNDNQFGALASFVFNIGSEAFKNSTLLRKLNAGDYAAVPSELARWNKNDGAVMAGLTKRRAAEAALWRAPVSTVPNDDIPHHPVPPNVPVIDLPDPPEGGKFPAWLWVIAVLALLAIVGLFARF